MLQSVSSLKYSFMLLWIPLSPVTITERTSIKTLSWIMRRWVKKPHIDREKERRKISSLQELFTSTAVEYSIHALCRWTQALLEEDCFLIWIFGFFTDHIKGGLALWEFIQKQWMCHLWGHFAHSIQQRCSVLSTAKTRPTRWWSISKHEEGQALPYADLRRRQHHMGRDNIYTDGPNRDHLVGNLNTTSS